MPYGFHPFISRKKEEERSREVLRQQTFALATYAVCQLAGNDSLQA